MHTCTHALIHVMLPSYTRLPEMMAIIIHALSIANTAARVLWDRVSEINRLKFLLNQMISIEMLLIQHSFANKCKSENWCLLL